jgi:hypothetical protein
MHTKKTYTTLIRDGTLFASLLLSVGLMGSSCDKPEEAVDDFDSRVACTDYCDKKADCGEQDATRDETKACVNACRDAIEDKCGNEHQAAANDQIAECVDNGCAEFWSCMVFNAAPECYGFVDG